MSDTPGLTSRSGMVSVDLEPGTIPPGHLKVDEVPHITIVYLGSDVDDEAFARACRRAAEAAAHTDGPVIAAASGVASFPPGDSSSGKVPVYMPVGSPALHQLRTALEDLSASEHKDYIPHITLDYAEPGKPLPEPPPPAHLTFTHISVHRGKEVKKYPFRDQGHPVVKLTDVHPYDRFERGREEMVRPARTGHLRLAGAHPSLLDEVQKQVKGYFRYEHGKLEHVGPYLQRKPEHASPEQKWIDATGDYVLGVDERGATHALRVGGSGWEKVPPWREKSLWRNSVEITGGLHSTHLPQPSGEVAAPAVIAEPGFDAAPLRAYLTRTLTPAELDVLNKAGVHWHIVPARQLDPTGNTLGLYDGSKLTVTLAGDADKLGGLDTEAVSYGHTLNHVALHETGHAIDHALGWVSERDPLAWHFADKVFPEGSHPHSGPTEGFAELFALLHDHAHTREWGDNRWQDVVVPEEVRRKAGKWLAEVEASAVHTYTCAARIKNGHLVFGPPAGGEVLVSLAQSLMADVVTAGVLELAGVPDPAQLGPPVVPGPPGFYIRPGDTISGHGLRRQRYVRPGDTFSGHAYARFPRGGNAGAGFAGGAGPVPPSPGAAGEDQPAGARPGPDGAPGRAGRAGRGKRPGRQQRR